MTIQPRNNRLLVQFHMHNKSSVLLPDGAMQLDANKTKCEVLAVAPELEHLYDPGDFLILHPAVNILPVHPADMPTGIINVTGVLAVVKYDENLTLG